LPLERATNEVFSMSHLAKLSDGSTFDVNEVTYARPLSDERLEVHFSIKEGDDWKSWDKIYSGNDACVVKAVLQEFTVDGQDIVPDDVAHIQHKGFGSFENFLKWIRNV
jgi:hypothetical protein